jgi:hypothetical protein
VLLQGNREKMELSMTEKIPAILAVTALLLGSTVMASAQTGPYQGPSPYMGQNFGGQAVGPNFRTYRYDPYAGTYWDGVAPYSSNAQPDPYAGTPWDGVAPY